MGGLFGGVLRDCYTGPSFVSSIMVFFSEFTFSSTFNTGLFRMNSKQMCLPLNSIRIGNVQLCLECEPDHDVFKKKVPMCGQDLGVRGIPEGKSLQLDVPPPINYHAFPPKTMFKYMYIANSERLPGL